MSFAIRTLGIVGSGAWGTALGETLVRAGREVRIFARSSAIVEEINARHINSAYLPNCPLDPRLVATGDIGDVARADVVLMVAPAQHTRAVAGALAASLKAGTPVVLCSKGIEQATGKLLVDVLADVLPGAVPAVLSGPSFADDVVRGLPVAVTLAAADAGLGRALAEAIGYRNFRVYWSDDLVGVQLGGAIKNVLAIAAGILDGKKLGASAHAALVTRGFAELRRFGLAYGSRPETLAGLSGLGDLLLTCGSAQSRNMSLGRALGQGQALADILAGRRTVSEGVYTAQAVATIARERSLDMPISTAVALIVGGKLSVDDAIEALLTRPFKAED